MDVILPPTKYVVITPARDEEKFIEGTIRSMIQQTMPPVEWVIVDDGSKDRTPEIIERYSSQHAWIRLVRRPDRGYRNSAGGEIDAFYCGFKTLKTRDWDFIVKLDGDLVLHKEYFENCIKVFQENPKIGIGGGTIYIPINGQYVIESCPPFHVRGATKIYRRDCWIDIGELIRRPGWDTLDEIKANMLGWETKTFQDIPLYQERATGEVEGKWRDNVKNGLANYVSGYHPLFMLAKCFMRIFKKPWIVGSLGLMYGYMSGYANRVDQVADKDLVKYIRDQQIRRLTLRTSLWKY